MNESKSHSEFLARLSLVATTFGLTTRELEQAVGVVSHATYALWLREVAEPADPTRLRRRTSGRRLVDARLQRLLSRVTEAEAQRIRGSAKKVETIKATIGLGEL